MGEGEIKLPVHLISIPLSSSPYCPPFDSSRSLWEDLIWPKVLQGSLNWIWPIPKSTWSSPIQFVIWALDLDAGVSLISYYTKITVSTLESQWEFAEGKHCWWELRTKESPGHHYPKQQLHKKERFVHRQHLVVSTPRTIRMLNKKSAVAVNRDGKIKHSTER